MTRITVNDPSVRTFSWLGTGGKTLEVTGERLVKEILLEPGEKKSVFFLDGAAPSEINIDVAEGASLELVMLRTPDCAEVCVNRVNALVGKNGHFRLVRAVLGGEGTYDDVRSVLEGDGSSFESFYGYNLRGSMKYDVNCEAVHTGSGTRSLIEAGGALDGSAEKIMRGTIDLRKGALDAAGRETEDVLLLSETARSLSVPVILCTEEDVSGDHGCTIGSLGDEELYYMASRGIDEKTAKRLASEGKLLRLIALTEDEETRNKLSEALKGDDQR